MKNLVELLEGREGMKLYSPICGECELINVNDQSDFPIQVRNNKQILYSFTSFGHYSSVDDAECLLFPSKEERTWENFQISRAKIGEQYYFIDTRNDFSVRFLIEDRDPLDDKFYKSGNYFLIRKEAEEFVKKVRNLFLERKKYVK